MWKLLNNIRTARILKNDKKLTHLLSRYDKFEKLGWIALN